MVQSIPKWMLFITWMLVVGLLPTRHVYSQESAPDSKTVIVTGTGAIQQNDAASAREKAIAESLITAIGIAMADVTPAEVLVPNFQSVNEILYAHTDNFINGYRVLAETKYKNRYRVLVQARISTQKIRDYLMEIGIMAGEIQTPRILLCIAEQNISDLTPRYWWSHESLEIENKAETILTEIFTQKGFIIMDPPDPSSYSDMDDLLLATPDPDLFALITLGKLAQADIIIVGRAFSEQTSNTMGEDIRSFKGTLQAKAIRVAKEDEIGSTVQYVSTVNTNDIFGGLEAITQAATIAGEDLAVQITASYRKKAIEQSKIKIVIKGTRILSNFVKFRKALSRLENVGEVRSSEMKSNEATLNVEYNENIQKLAESLMLQSFDSFGINISQVLPDQLSISLVPAENFQEPKPAVEGLISEEIPE